MPRKARVPNDMLEAAEPFDGCCNTPDVLKAALQWLVDELSKSEGMSPMLNGTYQDGWNGAWRHILRFLAPGSDAGIKPFKCGSGEMGTLYWSKDADLDKLPEMRPAPIDPEVDRIDFYIESSSGEYVPWKPTEGQLQMLSAMGLPTLLAGKGAPNPQSPPETGSSSMLATDTRP